MRKHVDIYHTVIYQYNEVRYIATLYIALNDGGGIWILISRKCIAGVLKGQGYSNDLLDECIRDARNNGRKGLCILSFSGRKKEFLSDPKYMKYKGFMVADGTETGINLLYLPLCDDAVVPKFKECAKHPEIEEKGYVIYYTDQCPFTYYWVPRVVEAAAEHGAEIKTVHITDKEMVRSKYSVQLFEIRCTRILGIFDFNYIYVDEKQLFLNCTFEKTFFVLGRLL